MNINRPPGHALQGLLAAKSVIPLIGSSRAHFYDLVLVGKFPGDAFKDGPRFTRWRSSDVAHWLADPQAWIDANTAVGV